MKSDLEINKIEIVEFKHPVKNLGKDYNSFNLDSSINYIKKYLL